MRLLRCTDRNPLDADLLKDRCEAERKPISLTSLSQRGETNSFDGNDAEHPGQRVPLLDIGIHMSLVSADFKEMEKKVLKEQKDHPDSLRIATDPVHNEKTREKKSGSAAEETVPDMREAQE